MSKRIKILFTIPNFKTAGSQYVLLSLFERIDKAIFDPYICVEKFPESIPSSVPSDRQLVFDFKGSLKHDFLGFRELLKTHKIDIVHSWDYKSNYLEALASRFSGVKYLYTKKNNAWSRRWKLKSVLSTHIAYDNPSMKGKFFSALFFKNKTTFIPHGVDTDVFKPIDSYSNENFNLVCIANITNNKNQLFLLKSLKQLSQNIVLHLYGKEELDYRETLDNYIKENNLCSRVFFKGYVENNKIPEVLKNMDLFILPSYNEGFPVSILEALASGVPVLSSDSGGGAKHILEQGGGYIFNLSNPKELLEHIVKLSQDSIIMKKLSLEARTNVLGNYSIKNEVSAYEKLYIRMNNT